MLATFLGLRDQAPRVLLIGAHCDDIEIGCGGAIQVLADLFPTMQLHWTVFSAVGVRAAETKRAAELLLPQTVSVHFDLRSFRESYFPYIGPEIKESMQALSAEFDPDLVFTHFVQDQHQDHRIISELTRNAYRDHLILEYEVAKYDGDLAPLNVFVPATRAQTEKKAAALMEAFGSQRGKHWFTSDTFTSLMRLRGIECRSPSGFAEGFHCRKLRFLA